MVLVPLLTTVPVKDWAKGKLVTANRLVTGVKLFEQVLAHRQLLETFSDGIKLGGNGAAGRIQIARNIDIGNGRNDGRALAIGKLKLLHQQITGVNHAIGIEIEELLNHHRVAGVQAVNIKCNGSRVGVADRRGYVCKSSRGRARGLEWIRGQIHDCQSEAGLEEIAELIHNNTSSDLLN